MLETHFHAAAVEVEQRSARPIRRRSVIPTHGQCCAVAGAQRKPFHVDSATGAGVATTWSNIRWPLTRRAATSPTGGGSARPRRTPGSSASTTVPTLTLNRRRPQPRSVCRGAPCALRRNRIRGSLRCFDDEYLLAIGRYQLEPALAGLIVAIAPGALVALVLDAGAASAPALPATALASARLCHREPADPRVFSGRIDNFARTTSLIFGDDHTGRS